MSMALKYAMAKKAKKMAEGCMEHGAPNCEMCHGGMMADGGEVKDQDGDGDMANDDIVDRIIKKMSKGGMVANDTPPKADFEDNDFDVLAKEDDLAFSDTGASAGDELGDKREDEDRADIVARIMRSRAKKDRMPRPA